MGIKLMSLVLLNNLSFSLISLRYCFSVTSNGKNRNINKVHKKTVIHLLNFTQLYDTGRMFNSLYISDIFLL